MKRYNRINKVPKILNIKKFINLDIPKKNIKRKKFKKYIYKMFHKKII